MLEGRRFREQVEGYVNGDAVARLFNHAEKHENSFHASLRVGFISLHINLAPLMPISLLLLIVGQLCQLINFFN